MLKQNYIIDLISLNIREIQGEKPEKFIQLLKHDYYMTKTMLEIQKAKNRINDFWPTRAH